jgi:hypothetical protein
MRWHGCAAASLGSPTRIALARCQRAFPAVIGCRTASGHPGPNRSINPSRRSDTSTPVLARAGPARTVRSTLHSRRVNFHSGSRPALPRDRFCRPVAPATGPMPAIPSQVASPPQPGRPTGPQVLVPSGGPQPRAGGADPSVGAPTAARSESKSVPELPGGLRRLAPAAGWSPGARTWASSAGPRRRHAGPRSYSGRRPDPRATAHLHVGGRPSPSRKAVPRSRRARRGRAECPHGALPAEKHSDAQPERRIQRRRAEVEDLREARRNTIAGLLPAEGDRRAGRSPPRCTDGLGEGGQARLPGGRCRGQRRRAVMGRSVYPVVTVTEREGWKQADEAVHAAYDERRRGAVSAKPCRWCSCRGRSSPCSYRRS